MNSREEREASAEIALRGIGNTEQATLTLPAYFRLRDVLHLTSLTRPTLYRRIAAGRFPPPVHLGGRACGWSRVALQAWIADPENYRAPLDGGSQIKRARGRPRKYVLA
jgi:predicted DNA-binding transcriptional regulator AlpA